MCDVRTIVAVNLGGEDIPVNGAKGHFAWWDVVPESLDPGLYCIGASGCGMYYYDSSSWYSDYEYNQEHVKSCVYITEPNIFDEIRAEQAR